MIQGVPDRSGARGRGPRGAAADPTRDIAFDIVQGVLEHRRMLETSLDQSAAARDADARDRAAAHRLAATVLRHMGTAGMVLEPFLKKEPPLPVRTVLLIGVAQILFLDTPAHAAVGTAVSLARRRGLVPFAGLVNAVLRRVAQAGAGALEGLDQARLDVPPWLWGAWGSLARPVAEALGQEAPLDLTLRPGLPEAERPPGGVMLPTGTLRLPAGTRVADLPGYAQGAFWVQDAAAALPARLLAPRAGERIADLCAAPGGKTAQLAVAGAEVTAIEREPGRLARLKENWTASDWPTGCKLVQGDAATWRPDAPLDAVLLDAPCSATGTAHRHPDVLWIKRPRLTALTEGQDRRRATCCVPCPAGLCGVLAPARRRAGTRTRGRGDGLEPDPFTAEELAVLPEALTKEGWLRTHPGLWTEQGGMDGFFAARFRRR
ncbi:putative ribosomal RNA small subunit methyltransferase B [Gluconacetobacter diazotrophicus PA1 5]|uniref:Putative ribosomal RNA small subunit methyltransferase B n=1 Tax=Gluconacetobacter diazotrophicus (strain ATCC 49037 / DSM 5601 / CCUG 37298 / CIP 103539 / LMG 7603 / PAl5) TaxID=272568 RepID=A9HMN1_GLUDA|nr:transcription antitermination factor NusB [Gluconacetobacter diazotrophicus]CAP56326.1 putative ribosomal RNA small subunit methyltransferase B [Gluconacetobacter diazotrophicus PA1 5]